MLCVVKQNNVNIVHQIFEVGFQMVLVLIHSFFVELKFNLKCSKLDKNFAEKIKITLELLKRIQNMFLLIPRSY